MRRKLKWLSLGLAVPCVVGFSVGLLYFARVSYWRMTVGATAGGLLVEWSNDEIVTNAQIDRFTSRPYFLPTLSTYDWGWQAFLPLWLPMLTFVALFITCCVADHLPKPGHCSRCGYNLTGNASGVCPECGREVAADTRNP